MNIITGNTDLGLNGSANGSIIFNFGESNYNDAGDPGALVVADNGYIFIRDYRRGLIYIDPSDGIIRQIAKQTGSYSGDGGSVFNATFKDLSYLTMDHEGNLLVWDASRIRKIDLSKSPWTIDRFIGGGSDTGDGAVAVDASIDYKSNNVLILVPTPSGKIYFSKGTKQIWYYDPFAKTVHKEIEFHGLGTDNLSGNKAIYDNSLCTLTHPGIQYDVNTSELVVALALARRTSQTYCGEGSTSSGWSTNFDVVTGEASPPHVSSGDDNWSAYKYTGMDGRLYLLEHGRDRLMVYNPGTRSYENLAGKVGTPGRCPDGTDKDDCNMKLMSLFVNKDGTIYFIDMGVIRYIDLEGKVRTIAGQPRNYGVGLEAQYARYAQVEFFQEVGDKIFIKDSLEQQITAVPLNGGTIEHVAGNSVKSNPTAGSDSRTSPLNNCKWAFSCGFFIEEASNRLYHGFGSKIFYLDLDTYTWGDTSVPTKAQASMLGGDQSGKIIYYDNEHYGASGDKTRLFVLDTALNTRTKIYGSDIAAKNYSKLICDDGSDGVDCFIGYTHNNSVHSQYKFDSVTNSWIFFKRNTNTIHLIPRDGGVVTKLTDLSNNAYSITSRREGSDQIIYYCASNGSLYKKNLTTSSESQITLGVSSIKCAGNSLHYSSSRDSLMFIFYQNYLYGIAEITAPGI